MPRVNVLRGKELKVSAATAVPACIRERTQVSRKVRLTSDPKFVPQEPHNRPLITGPSLSLFPHLWTTNGNLEGLS